MVVFGSATHWEIVIVRTASCACYHSVGEEGQRIAKGADGYCLMGKRRNGNCNKSRTWQNEARSGSAASVQECLSNCKVSI